MWQSYMSKKGSYYHTLTVAHNTWFERCHTSAATCVPITYCFAVNITFQKSIRECSIVENEEISSETIADRFSFCREILA